MPTYSYIIAAFLSSQLSNARSIIEASPGEPGGGVLYLVPTSMREIAVIPYGTKFSRSTIFADNYSSMNNFMLILRVSLCGATVQAPCLCAILAHAVSADHEAARPPRSARQRRTVVSPSLSQTGRWRMQNEQQQPTPKPERESYAKFADGQEAEISKRAAEHGIAPTIRHFTKKYPDLRESSVRTWKNA